jgi:hypothetical protein
MESKLEQLQLHKLIKMCTEKGMWNAIEKILNIFKFKDEPEFLEYFCFKGLECEKIKQTKFGSLFNILKYFTSRLDYSR